jgi:hypothetical protein
MAGAVLFDPGKTESMTTQTDLINSGQTSRLGNWNYIYGNAQSGVQYRLSMAIVDQIIGAESGGDPNAANLSSRAAGAAPARLRAALKPVLIVLPDNWP